MTAESPAALYEVSEHIALITLNRPEGLNVLNTEMSEAVGQLVEDATNDPHVRVIVITAPGDRAFCAGGDISEFSQGIDDLESLKWGPGGTTRQWTPKPIIAAVNGVAFGGGFELMAGCDLVVAAENAKFALPEVKLGIFAAAGGALRTPKLIPQRLAMELLLTGEPIDAAIAKEWGLINRVVPRKELMDAAMELARTIAARSPEAIRTTKEVAYRALAAGSDWNMDWTPAEDPWDINFRAWDRIRATPDGQEGPKAFVEKRAPQWTDS